MQNTWSRYFWALNLYLLTDLKIVVALFTTFRMQEDDTFTFLLEMFQFKVICKKAVSKGWCKESSCKKQANTS